MTYTVSYFLKFIIDMLICNQGNEKCVIFIIESVQTSWFSKILLSRNQNSYDINIDSFQ